MAHASGPCGAHASSKPGGKSPISRAARHVRKKKPGCLRLLSLALVSGRGGRRPERTQQQPATSERRSPVVSGCCLWLRSCSLWLLRSAAQSLSVIRLFAFLLGWPWHCAVALPVSEPGACFCVGPVSFRARVSEFIRFPSRAPIAVDGLERQRCREAWQPPHHHRRRHRVEGQHPHRPIRSRMDH